MALKDKEPDTQDADEVKVNGLMVVGNEWQGYVGFQQTDA